MSVFIAAIQWSKKPIDASQLKRSLRTLQHQESNNQETWINHHVGIARSCQQTNHKLNQEQLLTYKRGNNYIISADCRLDNRIELRSKLNLPRDVVISDSELIICAYEKWRTSCVDYFIGDFSFALWDAKSQKLFCARDHFGVKPFCYSNTSNIFICASKAKAILCWDDVPNTINEGRIVDFFVPELEGIDNTSTCFKHIHHLPPAHILVASQNSLHIQQYWQPDTTTEHRFTDLEECHETFRGIFAEAVDCRLSGLDKCASMLSGGLDSSSIVATAQSNNITRPLLTFSGISAPNHKCNETWHIKHMVEKNKVQPYFLQVDQLATYIQQIEELFHHTDNIFDMLMFLPQLMYILAREQGCTVLLDGIDGDYVTGQSGHYLSEVIKTANIGQIYQQCQNINHSQRAFGNISHAPIALLIKTLRHMVTPNLLIQLKRHLTQKSHVRSTLANSVLSEDCANRINLQDRLNTHYHSSLIEHSRTFREKNAQLIRSPYVAVGLERYNRVASVYGIEPRHPFFDKRLVDFCLKLNWQQKTYKGWSKAILRKSITHHLPPQTRWRKMANERLNNIFSQTIIHHLHPLIMNSLKTNSNVLENYVSTNTIERVMQLYEKSPNIDNAFSLWYLGSASLWLKKHQT